MMEFGSFVLLRPYWLLALLALPLLALAMRAQSSARSGWEGRIPARLQPLLLRGSDRPGRQTPLPWLLLSCSLIILALSGPAWDRQPLPLARSSDARVAVFDLSPSMGAADLKPDRLTRARYKLIDWLARRADGQTGLVVFGGQAFAVAPLTDDARTLRHLAEVLDPSLMPVPGARADLGLRKALELLAGAGAQGGEILLITDGVNRRAEALLPELRERGVRLSVLAVGTTEGAPVAQPGGGFLTDRSGAIVLPRLDPARLADLARRGGGRYARISADGSDLDRLEGSDGARSARDGDRDRPGEQRSSDYWQDRGPWLLLLALPFAALLFRRGWLLVGVLAIGLQSPQPAFADGGDDESSVPAAAGWSWRDLWLRRDQQAARALAADDAERAESLAPTPDWRGAAAASAGDYARAASHFAQQDDAGGAYNQGTALAQAGRYQEAIEALKQAIERDPEHDDARANLQAIEDWLAQQPPEQSEDQQGNDGEQDEEGEQSEQNQQDQDSQGEQSQHGEQDQSGEQGEAADGSEQAQPPGEDGLPEDGQEGQDEPSVDEETAQEQATQEQTDDPDHAEQAEQAQPQAGEESADEQPTRELAGEIGPEEEAAERQQALEQWLRRVPDDPGGLLRRKFQLESRRQPDRSTQEEDSEW